LFIAIANEESPKIATAGKVKARSTELIWDGWHFPVDNQVVTGITIEIKLQEQILYLAKDKGIAELL
jgi:hypothetical protein